MEHTTDTGTVTNDYRFFTLRVRTDTAYIRVSFLGYESQAFRFTESPDSLLIIDLRPHVGDLDGVTILAPREEALERQVQMSSHTLLPTDVATLPVMLSEPALVIYCTLVSGADEDRLDVFVRAF